MLTPERRDGIQRWAAKAGGFPGHAITDLLATIEALEAERDGWKAEAMWVAERLAAAAPKLQAAQRSQFWGFLGDWEEWGPRIQVAGLPTCAGQAIAHLYGNHDTPYAYCPQCDDDALAAAFSEEPEAPQPRTVDMAGRPVAELDTRTLTGEQ